MEETQWRTSTQSVKEGFDIFGDDYFINVKRKLPLKGMDDIIAKIIGLLKVLGNPVKEVDKQFEEFLQRILILMMGKVDCDTGESSNKLNDFISDFTWANGSLQMLDRNIKLDGFTTRVEGFSVRETPDLLTTIDSFMTNHPNIKNKVALTTYYIKQLNAYEASLGAHPNADELFVFNNEFDNALSSNNMFDEVEKIAATLPNPSYNNTSKGFASYLKKHARFSITSGESITYYSFNPDYFPAPIDISGFELALKDKNNPMFVQKLNGFLTTVSTPAELPIPSVPQESPDLNFAFSLKLGSTMTKTVPEYLAYVAEWFAFIVYKKQGISSTKSYATIQATICAVYVSYLNAVEFQKYRVYSTFMTPHEIALFNHMFFIYLQQDTTISTVYNLPMEGGIDIWQLTAKANPNTYVNTVPLSIYQLVLSFVVEINSRIPFLTKEETQPLPMDVVITVPALPEGQVVPPIYVLLCDYLLDNYTPTEIGSQYYPLPVDIPLVIKNYFVPGGMSACEIANQNIANEAKSYAKTIKKELYRLLTIPIIMYLVYNFYYLFFFKDCFDPVKKTDDTGKVYYEHTCEANKEKGKNGCFVPIFPDWETKFHSFEGHKLDYILEFIFKPVKFFYTYFNAFKTIFRWSIFGKGINDQVPYIMFLASFFFMYGFIHKRGSLILSMLSSLLVFKIPDFKVMGQMAFKSFVKSITIISFILTFLKKFFGISFAGTFDKVSRAADVVSDGLKKTTDMAKDLAKKGDLNNILNDKSKLGDMAENFLSKGEEFMSQGKNTIQEIMAEKEPTSIEWITQYPYVFNIVFRSICSIIYWMMKFVISLGMTTFSMFIFVIYFLYNLLFGMSNYMAPSDGTNSKIDLMFRVMYTRLCDNKNDGTIKYAIKSFIFVFIFFLTELLTLHMLYKGMKSFNRMKKPFSINPGRMSNNDNNLAVKSFMIIVYGCMMGIVILWCMYKFRVRMPDIVSAYSERTEPDDTKDKRMKYDCAGEDQYERSTMNSFITTFFGSDRLNKIFYTQLKEKMPPPEKTSGIEQFITKMSEISNKVKEKASSLMNTFKSTPNTNDPIVGVKHDGSAF